MKSKAHLIGSALGLTLLAAFCFNPMMQDTEGAAQTLKADNLQPTHVGGYGWLSCGKGDIWKTKFDAVNAKGEAVHGTVCKGFFKGSTIRFD